MENVGKADIEVVILNSLPGIETAPTKYNFDITAFSWPAIKDSPFFYPIFTEQIIYEGDKFGALMPLRRKYYVDNFIKGSKALENVPEGAKFISFEPCEKDEKTPLVNALVKDKGFVSDGQKWSDIIEPNIANADDYAALSEWIEFLGKQSGEKVTVPELEEALTGESKNLGCIEQSQVRAGLYWGVKSESFLNENTPFWVNFKITKSPATDVFPTWLIISLGLDNVEDSYDIYMGLNVNPCIKDYPGGRQSGISPILAEMPNDLSKILDSQQNIDVSVMTVAGRLVVWVNQVPMIYNRIDSSAGDNAGGYKECKIPAGGIRIYGSNVQATINVSPMTFAPVAIMALPIPIVIQPDGSTEEAVYQGVTNVGSYEGSVCELPQQPDKLGKRYGVDCATFSGDGGSAQPEGVGLHKQGTISFQKAGAAEVASYPNGSYYVLTLRPEDTTIKNFVIPNGGCPYFFALKGGAQIQLEGSGGGGQIAYGVITASESSTGPDYFHALTTASVTLYNKGGVFDDLKSRQAGITIKWGWNGDVKQTFTGIITSTTTGETAGQETITLQCQDYMYVLKNTPIVNSPFYDGMVGYYAIKDLAERAGITNFIKDWESEEDYFLPSGYAFTKPVMKFESKQMLFDCIIDIVKRFEAFVYFDSYGAFHINKLPGGLFSDQSGVTTIAAFGRDPYTSNISDIILDEKAVEYSLENTANKIVIVTLERNTRSWVIYTKTAIGLEDHLLFRKVMLLDQPALGDLEVARTYAERLGQRIFYPIRKTGLKTMGTTDTSILSIFDFFQVDGDEFRLMGLNRSYSADDNSFINEYNGEWLGGK